MMGASSGRREGETLVIWRCCCFRRRRRRSSSSSFAAERPWMSTVRCGLQTVLGALGVRFATFFPGPGRAWGGPR
eukprot:2395545-Prymnesium_polylepis.1